MALHKQKKARKPHEPNFTLFPNFADKFLIFFDKELVCWRVTHYSRWAFRGFYSASGSRKERGTPWRRNDWTYAAKFDDEVAAMAFAKEKSVERHMDNPVFLLQLDL